MIQITTGPLVSIGDNLPFHRAGCQHLVPSSGMTECNCDRGQISNQALAPTPLDLIRNPPHYKSHPSGIECLTIVRHMNFNLGNAIKYIWRAGQKGSAIEDLEKAAFYIADEIERLKQQRSSSP